MTAHLSIWLNRLSVSQQGRGSETAESLATRLATARKELAWLAAGGSARFDHVLMNDDLEQSYSNLKALLDAEGVFPAWALPLTPAPSP